MTLSAQFRPGAPTVPQPLDFARAAEAAHLQFLTAEERATATLMGFYQDARLELEDFIRTGDLSVSDTNFYGKLLDETNRVGSTLNTQGAEWTSSVIPPAYSAGWRQNSSTVVPQEALKALSQETLGLIRETTDGIRASIRSAIAKGILEGLPADAVRQRILASGLTNIPHWPNVEYRAGVIARTETMRAYNAGNIAAIDANGARFVEWIASPDEATCSICLPRDGKVFRLPGDQGIGEGVDPFGPAVGPLPKIPAHPRCRCTVRARYRDQNGNVIRQGIPEIPPELPPDAMGGRDAPKLPAAAGDFDKALGHLNRNAGNLDEYLRLKNVSGGFLNEAGKARLAELEGSLGVWRTKGRLTEDEIRKVASFGKTNTNGHATTQNFLQARYGIKLGKITGWNAELRMATIRALERIRALNPSFVVDSTKFLHTIGDRPFGAKRFGSNTIARAFASGHVEGNMTLWKSFTPSGGRKLRAGLDVDAAEEVILHEFGHTIHARFGLHDTTMTPRLGGGALNPYSAVEAVGREWHEEYRSIMSISRGVAPDSGTLKDIEAKIDKFQAYVDDPSRAYAKSYNEQTVDRLKTEAESIRKALAGDVDHEYFPTEYGQSSYAEDFAESLMLYFLNPDRLKKFSPKRYDFIRDHVFGGQVPT